MSCQSHKLAPKPSPEKPPPPPRYSSDALDFFATTADPAGVLVNGLSFSTDAYSAALHLRHGAVLLLPGPRALPSFFPQVLIQPKVTATGFKKPRPVPPHTQPVTEHWAGHLNRWFRVWFRD